MRPVAWFFLFALLQIIAAALEGNLTAAQMTAAGKQNPFPLTMHLGAWSDLVLLPLLLQAMWTASPYWERATLWLALVLSAIVSVAMHCFWAMSTVHYEHLVYPGGGLTVAGWIHAAHMTLVL